MSLLTPPFFRRGVMTNINCVRTFQHGVPHSTVSKLGADLLLTPTYDFLDLANLRFLDYSDTISRSRLSKPQCRC